MGAIKHNNVHSVEMLTAGKGGQLSKSALLCGLACALLCCLPPAEHTQLRGRFNSSRGGHSDSALCKFSCELLPQVSLFCESEELVQLCFLNHLISTLRPTPRWGEAIVSAGKAPGPASRVLACCVCLCNLLKDSLLVGLAESFLCAEGLWPS